MTTASIISLARTKLLEQSTALLTDTTLVTYADFAYQDIARRIFPNSAIKTATVNFTSGISTNLPSDFGTLYSDALSSNGYDVFGEVSPGDFARLNNGGYGVTYEGGLLKVSPTTTTSVVIKYYPKFASLALSPVQDPQIDPYFHELIIYGILSRAYEDLQDDELASFYLGKYENMLQQKVNATSLFEENGSRGGQMFNPISIIGNGYNGGPNYW